MNWLAIINPHADHRREEHLQQLAGQLEGKLGAECAWTQYPNHACDMIRANRRHDGFIAVGGDGTISEIVNGMDEETRCLGIIPAGTGNGLARDLSVGDDEAALGALENPHFMVDGTLYHGVDAIGYRVEPGRVPCCTGHV